MKTLNINKKYLAGGSALLLGAIALVVIIVATNIENAYREKRCPELVIEHNELVRKSIEENKFIAFERLEVLKEMQKYKCNVVFTDVDT